MCGEPAPRMIRSGSPTPAITPATSECRGFTVTTTRGPANAAVVSNGDDLNHFSPNYFGKGFKWQLPDLEGSERAYRLAKVGYEQAGRKVLDATVGGKLEVFPKVSYPDLFSKE